MFVQNSENRARHKFIDASIEVFLEQAHHEDVISVTGPLDEYVQNANELIVPNIRYGEVQPITKVRYKSGAIILALAEGEKVSTYPFQNAATFSQLAIVEDILAASNDKSEVDKILRRLKVGDPSHEVKYRADALAHITGANVVGLLGNGYYKASGRPFIIMPFDRSVPRLAPSILHHELTHVLQIKRNPIVFSNDNSLDDFRDSRVQNELEAYSREADFIAGLACGGYEPVDNELVTYKIGPDNRPASTAAIFKNIIAEAELVQPINNFYPTPELKRLLASRGLLKLLLDEAESDK